jgi:hypothetical protein
LILIFPYKEAVKKKTILIYRKDRNTYLQELKGRRDLLPVSRFQTPELIRILLPGWFLSCAAFLDVGRSMADPALKRKGNVTRF